MFQEFPCHSRVRKTRKKKKGTQPQPGQDDKEEEEAESSKRYLATPKLSSNQRNETPILWIRIDPDMEWLHTIRFKQPEYMWIFQLQEDIDAVAQYEVKLSPSAITPQAARALGDFIHSFKAIEALNNTLNNPRWYYRVRAEAAKSMSRV